MAFFLLGAAAGALAGYAIGLGSRGYGYPWYGYTPVMSPMPWYPPSYASIPRYPAMSPWSGYGPGYGYGPGFGGPGYGYGSGFGGPGFGYGPGFGPGYGYGGYPYW